MLPANNKAVTVTVAGDGAATNTNRQPNHDGAGTGCATAVVVTKQRDRKIFEYNITKYAGVMMQIARLTSTLNELLDIDLFDEYGDSDRKYYIISMEQYICTGRKDYDNPFGEDDQEVFLGMFYKLTQREQKALLEMAKEKENITAEDVEKMFEDPPTRPFHVTLKETANKYEDGSQRFPFTSMDDLDAKDVIIKGGA
jgi:hypothetical protein